MASCSRPAYGGWLYYSCVKWSRGKVGCCCVYAGSVSPRWAGTGLFKGTLEMHRVAADDTMDTLLWDVPSSFLTQAPFTCFARCLQCSSARNSPGHLLLFSSMSPLWKCPPSHLVSVKWYPHTHSVSFHNFVLLHLFLPKVDLLIYLLSVSLTGL